VSGGAQEEAQMSDEPSRVVKLLNSERKNTTVEKCAVYASDSRELTVLRSRRRRLVRPNSRGEVGSERNSTAVNLARRETATIGTDQGQDVFAAELEKSIRRRENGRGSDAIDRAGVGSAMAGKGYQLVFRGVSALELSENDGEAKQKGGDWSLNKNKGV